MLLTLISLIFISATITYLLTPFTIYFAKKFNLVDNPNTRPHPAHTHKGIIPRAGGIPLFLGIFLPVCLLPKNKQIIGIVISAIVLILVGLWDDKKDRSPYIRLLTNVIAALIVIGVGINIPYITNPFGGILRLDSWKIIFHFGDTNYTFNIIADIIALIWIVWTMNIVGWSGGVDGQLPGFVAISAFTIGLLSLRFATQDSNQLQVTFLSFLTAGAFLGFLPWNFYPQRIMPGYGGKTLAGFMLGIISILSFSKVGTALLVLAVPMTDAIFMLVQRIISGKSPVWATSGHLHHHLLAMGWGKRRIAFCYWLISIIFGVMALSLNSKQKIFISVLMIVLIFGFISWINFLQKMRQKNEEEVF